jgi:hypothetical protein
MIRTMGAAALLSLAPALVREGQAPGPCGNTAITACTPELVAMVKRASAVLDSLSVLSTPPDAPAADRPVAVRFGTWLRDSSALLAAQAALARKGRGPSRPGAPPRNYAVETANHRNRLLAEAARFTFASKALEARHQAALSAIRALP